MFKVKLGKEIVIEMHNEIGILNRIAEAIASKGVSIQALAAWTFGARAYLHIVTDDNLRVKELLLDRAIDLKEQDVVLVELPHTPGMLRRITDCLESLNIGINRFYASSPLLQTRALLVFSSDDNQRAVIELNRLLAAYQMMEPNLLPKS